MINLPNPADLLWWQIKHYTQRLAEAKTTKEKSFLRGTLHNLKKKKDE
jgi:hypothetical protein